MGVGTMRGADWAPAWPWAGVEDREGALRLAFRAVAVGCQAATVWLTWPLWQVRESPPMLPALDGLPALDLGWALVTSLVVVLVAPRAGLVTHTALLLYAAAIDQTRIQPEVISLAFLLWGTLPSPTARTFARLHLVALWVWAGTNKLLSPEFLDGTGAWMVSGLIPSPPGWLDASAGYVIGFTELGVGVLALVPRTRRVAAVAIFGLHAGILLDLSPVGHDWNSAVWPWNAALAVSGVALIATWREGPRATLGRLPAALRPVGVALVLMPAGFYVGAVDAYLAHNLYSSNTPGATVRCEGMRRCPPERRPDVTWDELNVPLPPEHRVFETFFAETCEAGDVMTIRDSRWWFERRGDGERRLACGEGGSVTEVEEAPTAVPAEGRPTPTAAPEAPASGEGPG